MPTPQTIAALIPATLALAGIAQIGWGLHAVRRFATTPKPTPASRPPVTILKPLHGAEPLLEQALASFCAQTYPNFQIVFGVQDPTDPAIAIIRGLRRRFPDCDIDLVIDGARHGLNHKISNVINMIGHAKHDILVLADSDVHAAPDYLDHLVATLALPQTGIATTLYSGRPANQTLPARLGAAYISHIFLPGALMARALGRQDCLGASMALHRHTLDSLGGFAALVDHLADDAVLGRLVRAQGLAVRLAPTVPATTVPETTLPALYRHELRWARTIRSLAPIGQILSTLQFPIVWALLAVLLAAAAPWSLALLAAAWAARALAARLIDAQLGLDAAAPPWLMPVRELMSVALIAASFGGNKVSWRGQSMPISRPATATRPREPVNFAAPARMLGEG